ncbi:MAG TPA: hypothetical protein PK691_12260, partial [Thermomicrobiales bacterium]|nr:hypothetical protein [Thermomicrobiales bacterium]
ALALVGSAGIGLSNSASAADSGTISVSGTVATYLSLTLNRSAINFGDALTFTGQTGANSNAVAVCMDPLDTGIVGARFVGPNVVATVISSKGYTMGRGILPPALIPSILNTNGWVGAGAFVSCSSPNATGPSSIPAVMANPVLGSSALGTPLAGTSYTEFYMFDVKVNDPAAMYSTVITYQAIQNP